MCLWCKLEGRKRASDYLIVFVYKFTLNFFILGLRTQLVYLV